MDGPLKHIRVLDLTIARAGPMAVRLLADWGADVIKVEPPPRKDAQGSSVTGGRRGSDEQNLHRNKRSLSIDLKSPQGRSLFHKLAADADVVCDCVIACWAGRWPPCCPSASRSPVAATGCTPRSRPARSPAAELC